MQHQQQYQQQQQNQIQQPYVVTTPQPEDIGTCIYYTINVINSQTGEVWVQKQRYSNLYELHKQLIALLPPALHHLLAFPKKHWFTHRKPSVIEERRKAFQVYFQNALNLRVTHHSQILKDFLFEHQQRSAPQKKGGKSQSADSVSLSQSSVSIAKRTNTARSAYNDRGITSKEVECANCKTPELMLCRNGTPLNVSFQCMYCHEVSCLKHAEAYLLKHCLCSCVKCHAVGRVVQEPDNEIAQCLACHYRMCRVCDQPYVNNKCGCSSRLWKNDLAPELRQQATHTTKTENCSVCATRLAVRHLYTNAACKHNFCVECVFKHGKRNQDNQSNSQVCLATNCQQKIDISAIDAYFAKVQLQEIEYIEKVDEQEQEDDEEQKVDNERLPRPAQSVHDRVPPPPPQIAPPPPRPPPPPPPEEKTKECVICLDKPQTHTAVPCGHFAYCEDCTQTLLTSKKCAICQQPVLSVVKIYV